MRAIFARFVGLSSLLRVLLFWLLVTPAKATWSILIVDTATGEVAVGIATCLTGFDLRPNTVVVIPGFGVAAAQSFVGPLALRQRIRDELRAGTSPAQILSILAGLDVGHQSRQYGIVAVDGGAVTFTGSQAFSFANGLTGQSGTLVYAIQGNVLTGQPVLSNAELAIVTTQGDVGQKLMAAMEAARAAGGDGRCSCSGGNPTGCGSPPPSFVKSSHIGLVIVSREGDGDVPCSTAGGCAAGDYYLDLNVANQTAAAPDPVLQLQSRYATWRAQQVGRPDHFRSSIVVPTTMLRADGRDRTTLTVTLRDIDGNAIGNAPELRALVRAGSGATDVQLGPVTRTASGGYTVDVAAGRSVGEAIVDLVADDGGRLVQLGPSPRFLIGDPFGVCGRGTVDDGVGGFVDVLEVDGASGAPGRVIEVGFERGFTVGMRALPSGGGGLVGLGLFWLHLDLPTPAAAFPLGGNAGALCFGPAPFVPGAPTLLLADGLGVGGLFGVGTPPWSIPVPGLPVLIDLTLQGVLIENPSGDLAASNAIALRIVPNPAPTIAAIVPLSPPTGALVTVQGAGFEPGATLAIDGNVVPIASLNPSALTFTMPAGVGCDASLAVQNRGTGAATRGFRPTPTISFESSRAGPSAGGAVYLVTGTHFSGATLTIGGTPAIINSQSDQLIVATTPPGAVGPAPVVIETPSGCRVTSTYTYQ